MNIATEYYPILERQVINPIILHEALPDSLLNNIKFKSMTQLRKRLLYTLLHIHLNCNLVKIKYTKEHI